MDNLNILIVEDEKNLASLIKRVLHKEKYNVKIANNGLIALEIIKSNNFDLIITDIQMPEISGIELLNKVREIDDTMAVIIITAYASIDTAIEAIRMGAIDYIKKPFDIKEILDVVKKIESTKKNKTTISINKVISSEKFIANSKKMKNLISIISRIADNLANIHISGETGVGKELVAKAIHDNSRRKNKPFIKVNCSVFPENLLESELFGYEKGAFTGANSKKLGRFELANKGTIFLDEIGDISPLIQLKLLRIIQQKELERLGGIITIPLDIRIITATNKNLEELVKNNLFRQDLYYRLNVIPIFVPPLRERKEDLEELINSILLDISIKYNKKCKIITKEALKKLKKYDWPGNVRELENIIERTVVITESNIIEVENLPEVILKIQSDSSQNKLNVVKNEIEEKIIRDALKECNNNVTNASEKLGISRRSMHRKMKKYSI